MVFNFGIGDLIIKDPFPNPINNQPVIENNISLCYYLIKKKQSVEWYTDRSIDHETL